jgi:hypothetical protein
MAAPRVARKGEAWLFEIQIWKTRATLIEPRVPKTWMAGTSPAMTKLVA